MLNVLNRIYSHGKHRKVEIEMDTFKSTGKKSVENAQNNHKYRVKGKSDLITVQAV